MAAAIVARLLGVIEFGGFSLIQGCLAMFMTFAAFGIDKARAVGGGRRVRESTLLVLAMLGGTPGAYAGRALFRHKTRKQPFSGLLLAIAMLQLVVVGWCLL